MARQWRGKAVRRQRGRHMWDPEEKKKWIEWNLQKDFCRKKRLIWKAYPADREHDHCEFCWAKFWADPQADEGCLKAGFVIEGTDCWVCEECFEIFKDYFDWEIII